MRLASWIIAFLVCYVFQSGYLLNALNNLLPESSEAIELAKKQESIAESTRDLIAYHYRPGSPYNKQLEYCLRWSGYNSNPSMDTEIMNSINTCIEGKFGTWKDITGR